MPTEPERLTREGAELGLRFTPLDSAGLFFPGGKASYPSSLIMLAVPAQVAGVKRIVACTAAAGHGQATSSWRPRWSWGSTISTAARAWP